MTRLFGRLVLTLTYLTASLVNAQTITSSINGTITDPNGAVVVGARIVVTNIETNVSTATTTNEAGVYNIRFLQVGKYVLTVDASGFTQQRSKLFTLEAGQDAKFDAQMVIQGTNAVLNINSELVPLLNTENA